MAFTFNSSGVGFATHHMFGSSFFEYNPENNKPTQAAKCLARFVATYAVAKFAAFAGMSLNTVGLLVDLTSNRSNLSKRIRHIVGDGVIAFVPGAITAFSLFLAFGPIVLAARRAEQYHPHH